MMTLFSSLPPAPRNSKPSHQARLNDTVIDPERARKRREAIHGASEFERRVSGD